MRNKTSTKFREPLCRDDMTFQDCELAILRNAVDESENIQGQNIVNNEEIKKMLEIVERFIVLKKLVCYGGTAINNILPKSAQFYNRDKEVPDYDFYSPSALEDAKELADIYYKAGYRDVEAKAGVHAGTFKVFVNFIGIADITQMHSKIYKSLLKNSIVITGIHYCPPNFLRMAMYLELSRPMGDVSRWEKVMKRLTLLNKHFPLKHDKNCEKIDFQREMSSNATNSENLYTVVRDTFINEGGVFFGGYATSMYSRYMSKKQAHIVKKIPDFDVLSDDPEKCAIIVKEELERNGFTHVKIVKHDPIGEVIPEHTEIIVGKETMAFIYKPIACHSYNTVRIQDKDVHIATIDTILSFYLAFLYAKFHNYGDDRLLCMAGFLFDVEQKNRLSQHGLLKRFSMNCYGKQPTLEEMRAEKANKYKEFTEKKGKEYENWFLKYTPDDKKKRSSIAKTDIATDDGDSALPLFGLFNKLASPVAAAKKQTFKQRLQQRRKTQKAKKSL